MECQSLLEDLVHKVLKSLNKIYNKAMEVLFINLKIAFKMIDKA